VALEVRGLLIEKVKGEEEQFRKLKTFFRKCIHRLCGLEKVYGGEMWQEMKVTRVRGQVQKGLTDHTKRFTFHLVKH
jgi:hypothetical protein